MKKTLVTGGLGYIGSHFISEFLKFEKNIICIDNCSNSNLGNIQRIKKISTFPFEFHRIGIESIELKKIFLKNEIDTIIHFAGLKAVGESVKYPAKYYYNNVIGSKNLFNLAKKFKIKNLIFSSSATVYGKPIHLPFNENHPIRATNPYGQNKIDIENLLINDDYFQNECSVKILRYFNPIGAHPTGFIGEKPRGIPNNLMPYILKVAKKALPEVFIFGNDYNTHDGTGVRDYIHIMDLIDGHIKSLNYFNKGVSIFNLGTGQGYSVLDLIHNFEKVNKIKIPFRIVGRRDGDVDSVFANPLKAQNILNFNAKKTLDEMCADAWRYETYN